MKCIFIFLFMLLAHITSAQKNNKLETFFVNGKCEMCKDRIEKTVNKLRVRFADWDVNSHMLTVSYDSTKMDRKKIEQALVSVGHDTKDLVAHDEVYEALPACCHYDRSQTALTTVNKQWITGIVLQEDTKGKLTAVNHANITNLHQPGTVSTDSFGIFKIFTEVPAQLQISYVGFKTDTIAIKEVSEVKIILKNGNTGNLSEVVVQSKRFSTYVSSINPLNTMIITSKELAKAACCNLSESFETSPSIDVSYTDGVTGMKQIQLLGLAGQYSQLLTENSSEIRGLAGPFGLSFVPGPWLESIEVTKGIGTVVNGYESMTGQINIEEKKPDRAEKLFINGYINSTGRMESNIMLAKKLNDKWSTGLLTNINGSPVKNDHNKDGFLDMPTGRQFNIVNRWKYEGHNGWIIQLALKALSDKRIAGQTNFDEKKDKLTTHAYGLGIDIEQYAATSKVGYVFPNHKYKSIGWIVTAVKLNNNSYYGLRPYEAQQGTLYSNLIYQNIIGNSFHKFRTGISFLNETFKEKFNASPYQRRETVPGAYFEYNYSGEKKLSVVAGIRADYHNDYHWMVTPRLHVKYDFTPQTNLRLSAGSGFRTANIFAENTGLFISSRDYMILDPINKYGYGLGYEKAWNYGLNLVHNFHIGENHGSISLDAYHTKFTDQTVVDIDASTQQILFYPLQGKSFSNSLQAEINYSPFYNFEIRLAYRWLDVQTQYKTGVLEKPLIAKNRGFLNLAYSTHTNWKFDVTSQWYGPKRIPNTLMNPADKQMASQSPAYMQLNAQVSKKLGKKWELYLGAENITNYVQEKMILSADNPFSNYFDASLIWGPVNERLIYAGFRFKIK